MQSQTPRRGFQYRDNLINNIDKGEIKMSFMKKISYALFFVCLMTLGYFNMPTAKGADVGPNMLVDQTHYNGVLLFQGTTRFNLTSSNSFTSYPNGAVTWATDGSKGNSFSSSGSGCL